MRSTRAVEIGTGLFVLLGFAALFFLVTQISKRQLSIGDTTYRLEARFDDTPLERVQGTFDLVVANLFAEVIAALAPHLRRVTGRHLVLAGILADRAHLVEAALSGMRQVSRRQDGDWVSMEYAA